jgi:serine/threonine protein phosphatase PrpC
MRAVSLTNRGGRKNNEDSIGYAEKNGIRCFVICDGLGGQSCGEVASKLVCDSVCAQFEREPQLSDTAAFRCIEKAASVLGEEREADEAKADMSSTVALLITDGNEAVWANVGDSRIYCISDYEITQVTNDHSVAFMEFERGDITYSEIRHSKNQNKLLRAVSDIESINPDVSEVTPVKTGDAFLLCTDGFWEYVTEDDIEETLQKSASPKEWLEKMLSVLHENETEKNDNYSAIAVII